MSAVHRAEPARRSLTMALAALALLALTAARAADVASVTFNGSLGATKALLLIDGTPRTLAVGESHRGVKLLSVTGDEAEVSIDGRRVPLRIGATQVNLGGRSGPGSAGRIVLTAGPGGHFTPTGSINGHAARFLVDTGATSVAIGLSDAARLGLDLKNARRAYASTANGNVAVHLVTLDSVRVGDVEVFNVDAVITPSAMPHVLLGNSFLTRFQMRRENDTLTLEKRP